MKAPTQCALWTNPERSNDPDLFEVLENFVDEEHWSRDLRRCRECGQLYVHDFYEEMNFSGGEDSQSACYVPVATQEDIDAVKGVTPTGILRFHPCLSKDLTGGTARWIME